MKSNKPEVNITYHWGIENNEKWTNLTWSSTLMKIKDWLGWDIKVVIDFWMHQWGKNANELNEHIDDEIIKADYIVITHAHMDHVWRLPMLVKKWFKGKIIMTNITKQIAFVMLSDYVRLTERQIKEIKEYNEKVWTQFKKYLHTINIYNELKKWWLDKIDKIKKTKKLAELLWIEIKNLDFNNQNVKAKIDWIQNILDNHNIKENYDIKLVQKREPTLLYNLDHVYKTMSLIETIEIWDELDLDNRIFINSINDNRILDLPKLVNSKKIYVWSGYIKQQITHKLKNHFDAINTNTQNKQLIKKLTTSFNKNKKTQEDIDFLNKYWIQKKEDIESLQKQINIYNNIHNITKKLQLAHNSNINNLESLKLIFHNAWHIEWSVQATIKATTKKLVNFLDNNNKRKNNLNEKNRISIENYYFWFSWDLWKFTDPNISWSFDIPPYKYNFFQCESTYADKNHIYKKEKLEKFIKEINLTKWKVLIPAFSLQRTQEIIIELLNNKLSKQDLIEEYSQWYKNLKKLKNTIIQIYQKNDLTQKDIYEIQSIEKKIEKIQTEIDMIKEQVFLYDIIIDSPLSEQITHIFLEILWEKYKLLDEWMQNELFQRTITKHLANQEYKKLYTDKTKKQKHIIISAWWMLQWGSIINHLKEVISDPNAKIIFTGYQAEWTLWRELLDWKDAIIINWEVYSVKCNIVQIWWFSSHIWKKDIIDYLTKHLIFSKWSIIALNHWWESRQHLRYEINKINPKQKIKIPDIWDTINIKL